MNYIDNSTNFDILYVLGDTHGENMKIAPHLIGDDKSLSKCILHCGDFGIGFSSVKGDVAMMERLNTRLKKYNTTMYVVRGNHDDPKWFNSSGTDTEEHQFPNVILVPDHTILNLTIQDEAKVVYMNGGAISIDRCQRIPGRSYWWNENVTALSAKDLALIPDNLDIVITHTRPQGVFPINKNGIEHWLLKDMALDGDLDIELGVISDIFEAINAKNSEYRHYYGHFHDSYTECIDGRWHSLLNICELREVRC